MSVHHSKRNPVSVHHSGRNPVSVHHSEEIRCQFIILARKDEPTPDYVRKDEPTPDYVPDYVRKDEPTPDYVRLDTGLRAARRYYEALRLPDVPFAALRFLRLAIPSLRPSFVPDGPGHGAVDPPGVGKPGLRPAFRWRRQGLPSSRGTLVIIRHVLRPRWDQAG